MSSTLKFQEVELNMVPYVGNIATVYASQYDVGRGFRITLKDDDQPYIIPESAIVQLAVLKPDGKTAILECTFEENIVYAYTTIQSTAVAGYCTCEIQVTVEDSTIGSNNFRMRVEQAAESIPANFSDTEITQTFNRILDEAKLAVAEAKKAKDSVAAFIPENGSSGQYLVKTVDGVAWANFPSIGDMTKETYDTNNDGVVDEASKVSNDLKFISYEGEDIDSYNGSTAKTIRLPIKFVSKSLKLLTSKGAVVFDNTKDMTVDTRDPAELPSFTLEDSGKVLTVEEDGTLGFKTITTSSSIGDFTADDAGKFLVVGEDGKVTLMTINNGDNQEF